MSPRALSSKRLEGLTFGRLIAIDVDGLDRSGHLRWLCSCECGTFVRVVGHDLVRKHVRSCGCLRAEKAGALRAGTGVPVSAGTRYGLLTVSSEAGRDEAGRVRVQYRCDCGTVGIARWNNVRNGITKSCGHLKRSGGVWA